MRRDAEEKFKSPIWLDAEQGMQTKYLYFNKYIEKYMNQRSKKIWTFVDLENTCDKMNKHELSNVLPWYQGEGWLLNAVRVVQSGSKPMQSSPNDSALSRNINL